MADKEKILTVLGRLDALDDEQWTSDGAPKVDLVSELAGEYITRKEIIDAAPDFNRKKASSAKKEDKKPEPEPKLVQEMTDAEFAAYLNSVPEENLQDLIIELRAQKIVIDNEIEEKKILSAWVKQAISLVIIRSRYLNPDISSTEAIRHFIDSQNQARIERVAAKSELLKHLSASDIDSRSPIDAAMSIRNNRAGNRPIRPNVR